MPRERTFICAVMCSVIVLRGLAALALEPGDTLSRSNWQAAEGLMPPEILAHYQRGEYANAIVAWPTGMFRWDAEFMAATERNADAFTVNEHGTIVERTTGQQPPFIFGFPFPRIDPADPNAGIKVLWNFNYGYWYQGSSHNQVELIWVRPDSVDRKATQDVYFLYYDGQLERYRPANPNNYSMQFIATAMSPADLHGTTSLTWRYRDSTKRDSNWVFVPALRRVRGVSPANRSDGFLGSDMSQDDGPFFDGKPEDFAWKLIGEREQLRFVDPLSVEGQSTNRWLPTGGWRGVWPPGMKVLGFQDPTWTGIAWAPIRAALAKRAFWVIEATPKDRYYLYGRLELYVDKETFQGAWSRKFSWQGELLNTLQVLALLNHKRVRPDGIEEYILGGNMAFQCAENVKANRATTGSTLAPINDPANDRRVPYDPRFFDYSTLQRFGK